MVVFFQGIIRLILQEETDFFYYGIHSLLIEEKPLKKLRKYEIV